MLAKARCTSSLNSPGQSAASVASFVDMVATQLSPQGVHTYEIGNEVNYQWSAATYVAILNAAYAELHRVDSSAFVISAGLGPFINGSGCSGFGDYVTAMYQAGVKGNFDALALHPYTWPNAVDSSGCSNSFEDGVTAVRAVMVSNGDSGKQIWLTEAGGPTGTDGGYGPPVYTEPQLAQAVATLFSQSKAWGYIGNVFIYNWIDQHNYDGDFGLYYSAYNPKPDVVSAFMSAVP